MLTLKDLLDFKPGGKRGCTPRALTEADVDSIEETANLLMSEVGINVSRPNETGSERKLERIRRKAIYAQSRLLVWFLIHWGKQKYRRDFSVWVESELAAETFGTLFDRQSFVRKVAHRRLTELETEFQYFASMQCCCSRRLGGTGAC